MTVAVMWEARAAEGRGPELLEWARAQQLRTAAVGGEEMLRRETLTAPGGISPTEGHGGDRVLVITWWDADLNAELPELAEPRADLVTRPVHRWRFESVEVAP
jgi:hypothetical protein